METSTDEVVAASNTIEIVVPPTRFDAVAAQSLRAEIHELVRSVSPRVVVDLADVEFVDSAGLAALISGMKQARRRGGDLRLVAPRHPDAVRIFDLTCLTDVFAYVDSAAGTDDKWEVD